MSLFVNENNALGFNGLAEIIGILVFGAVALWKAYCHAYSRMIPESFISQVEKKESKVTTCLKAVRGTYELLQTVQSAKTSLSEHKNSIFTKIH